MISRRAVKPDLVLSHAVHQAARLRPLPIPVAIYLPGPPNPRYVADLQLADGLISDGWAAKHLPGMIGRPVDDVLKGVDTAAFTPERPESQTGGGGSPSAASCCASRGSCRSRTCRCSSRRLPTCTGTASTRRSCSLGEGPQESVAARAGRGARRLGVRALRRIRAAGGHAGVVPIGRRLRAGVRLRQLAERRARSDGVRPAGRRDRRRAAFATTSSRRSTGCSCRKARDRISRPRLRRYLDNPRVAPRDRRKKPRDRGRDASPGPSAPRACSRCTNAIVGAHGDGRADRVAATA